MRTSERPWAQRHRTAFGICRRWHCVETSSSARKANSGRCSVGLATRRNGYVDMKKTRAKTAVDSCSVDERTGTRELISLAVAVEQSLALASPVNISEVVGLEDAIGRVWRQDLVAPFPLPPFDNSAMDGYALRGKDLSGTGPWRLCVTGRVAAGDNADESGQVGPGEAFRIFTGAAIPRGADAVIMQEHVRLNDKIIEFDSSVDTGSCIRREGEDAAQGSLLLRAGTLIGAQEIGAIASVGRARIPVFRKSASPCSVLAVSCGNRVKILHLGRSTTPTVSS